MESRRQGREVDLFFPHKQEVYDDGKKPAHVLNDEAMMRPREECVRASLPAIHEHKLLLSFT